MNRSILIAAISLFNCDISAKSKEPCEFYPDQIGFEWVYKDGRVDVVLYISKVDTNEANKKLITINRKSDQGDTRDQVILISKDGVYLIEEKKFKLDPPRCLIKLPVVAGNTWSEKHVTKNGSTWDVQYKTGESRVIKVPAGSFNAVPVISTYKKNGAEIELTKWYSCGKGLIQEEYTDAYGSILQSIKPQK